MNNASGWTCDVVWGESSNSIMSTKHASSYVKSLKVQMLKPPSASEPAAVQSWACAAGTSLLAARVDLNFGTRTG